MKRAEQALYTSEFVEHLPRRLLVGKSTSAEADYLNLSVLANTIYLPLILTNSHQSQNVINQENYDPYPAPYDEDASKLYQPSSQPNPYP